MAKLPEFGAHFTPRDIDIIDETTAYQGFFQIKQYKLRHKLFNGNWSNPLSRELFVRGHAAALLPYDPARDEIILLQQFRIGALASRRNPWLLELVAGVLDKPDEDVEDLVRREAQEEAGLSIKRCEKALSYLVSPGGTSERIDVYIGEVDASFADTSQTYGLASEGEDIAIYRLPFSKAMDLLNDGQIDNAASVIALQWLAINHQALRQRWSGY